MSNTMMQLDETITEINNLRNKEKMLTEKFEKSTGELAECFHWILKAKLEGRKQILLSNHMCPELYANALRGMGFEIEEERNCANTLCGYYVRWN